MRIKRSLSLVLLLSFLTAGSAVAAPRARDAGDPDQPIQRIVRAIKKLLPGPIKTSDTIVVPHP